ncbi:hypothetical protein, partial [Nocardia cyriacigeorgica]|uniref:hypothetical protein n=1 Tax=Nocardia cyriacigeorgica TaxID=135487 RepID=UPI0024558B96
SSWAYMEIEFDVPAGAEIAEILVTANIGKHEDGGPIVFAVMGSTLGHHWGVRWCSLRAVLWDLGGGVLPRVRYGSSRSVTRGVAVVLVTSPACPKPGY